MVGKDRDLLKDEKQVKHILWVAKVLLLFCRSDAGDGYIQEFAYVQCMDVTSAVSGVHR